MENIFQSLDFLLEIFSLQSNYMCHLLSSTKTVRELFFPEINLNKILTSTNIQHSHCVRSIRRTSGDRIDFVITPTFQIHKAVQQMGFRRFKRGYKADRLAQITRADNAGHKMRDPTDPYFPYQWYLVSNSI